MGAAPDTGLLSQMRRGTLQYCVLALLSRDELYAFEIVRALDEIEGLVTSEGTIYPLLSRLRREGLVDTTWRESETGPPRRYYRVSRKGAEALQTFAQEWALFRAAVDHLIDHRTIA